MAVAVNVKNDLVFVLQYKITQTLETESQGTILLRPLGSCAALRPIMSHQDHLVICSQIHTTPQLVKF
jgi:hypothetical protein